MQLPTHKLIHGADNYALLRQLCGDLADLPAAAKSKSGGFMDLSFDRLADEAGCVRIALAHYFKMNGDLVPDPDMEIHIFTSAGIAEALSFQNMIAYRTTCGGDGALDPDMANQLDAFLNLWLRNLIDQGHSLRPEARNND